MRAELETIAKIEQYLLGALSEVETKVFETRIAMNPNFKNEVELQAQLMHSLQRISLQQTIQNAQKTYHFWKLVKLIGVIVIPILIALITWFFVNFSTETKTGNTNIPTKVEQKIHEEHRLDTEEDIQEITAQNGVRTEAQKQASQKKRLAVVTKQAPLNLLHTIPNEIFTIQTAKDTIVETQNGIVLMIPKNTFVDANGTIVTENVTVKIKEASTATTIMTAGLGTLHTGKLLETGGMFFIEASQNGKKLQIHPEKEITADIPTQTYKNDMQLFDGEVLDDGTIDWVSPKPIHKTLIPQDILSLNFYPPNYLDSLAKKGYDIQDKKFTDSLYYSFQYQTTRKIQYDTIRFVTDALQVGKYRTSRRSRRKSSSNTPRDSVQKTTRVQEERYETYTLGLNPLKIKTIWNERFQHTFIATKAFEKRLQKLHQSCGDVNRFLDLYVKHLDWELHRIDALVSGYLSGEMRQTFIEFSKERLTNVDNLDVNISKLNNYYVQQQKVYRLALEKTQKSVDSLLKYDEKYREFTKKQQKAFYAKELAFTVEKVSADLGVRLPRAMNRTQRNQATSTTNDTISLQQLILKERQKRRYRTAIRTTGWKNIDRIINEEAIASVKNRTDTTIQNQEKKTTIRYSDYEISIEHKETFDELLVYLIPKEFNSFIRLKPTNGRFTYCLNELLTYDVYCIAYQKNTPFFFRKTIQSKADTVTLLATTTASLQRELSKIDLKNNVLQTEISFQRFLQQNDQKLKSYRNIRALKRELKSIVFPCKNPKKQIGFDVYFQDAMPVRDIIINEGEN